MNIIDFKCPKYRDHSTKCEHNETYNKSYSKYWINRNKNIPKFLALNLNLSHL